MFQRRKDGDSLQEGPPKEAGSQWYVPDVLNIQNVGTDEVSEPLRTYGTHAPDVTLRPNSSSALYQSPAEV